MIAETLAERFARGPMAVDEARRLARDLCAALLAGGVHGRLTAGCVVDRYGVWFVGDPNSVVDDAGTPSTV